MRRARAWVTAAGLALLSIGCRPGTQAVKDLPAPEDLTFSVKWLELRPALNDVHFVDGRTGWAVGENGAILATRDGGRNWEPQLSGTANALQAVCFVDATTGWIAGNSILLTTENGGATWTSKQQPGPLGDIFFIDAKRGWISDSNGILATSDGGKTWHRQPARADSLFFINSNRGWAVDHESIFATRNGGRGWEKQDYGADYRLNSAFFLDERVGWVSFDGGVLHTIDGGARWTSLPWPDHDIEALNFIDAQTGWAMALKDNVVLLLATKDGGRSWKTQEKLGESYWSPGAVWFTDPLTGYAVAVDGTILATKDGGESWQRQDRGLETDEEPKAQEEKPSIPGETINDVFMLDDLRWWAVGANRAILSSSDGGKEWKRKIDPDNRVGLRSVAFANANMGWAVGSYYSNEVVTPYVLATTDGGESWSKEGTPILGEGGFDEIAIVSPEEVRIRGSIETREVVLQGRLTRKAPFVKDFQVEDETTGSVRLSGQAAGEGAGHAKLAGIDFRAGRRVWNSIDCAPIPGGAPGQFAVRWSPEEYEIPEGTDLLYRVTLRDHTGLQYAHEIPGTFVYRSWRSRQPPLVQGAILGGGMLAGYAGVCLALLWLAPLALLRVHERIPIQDLLNEVPGGGAGLVANALLSATGLPTLARHPRTRRAWESCYRAGRASFSDLPAALRASYIDDPSCLDAWVERRVARAEDALQRIEAVSQRRVYIELPVRVGPREEGRRLPDPMQPAVRQLLAVPCAVLAVIGEGGTGKSTLACQFTRWALGGEPGSRLAAHRMIPVFLLEETRDLLGSIIGQLRSMVGGDEVEEDIVLSLLRSKRLLVLVDALSECTPEMQRHVELIHRSVPVNALVVTARRRPDFGPVPLVEIWPEKVSPEKLVYFLVEYLRRTGNDELFPDRQGIQLADRLLGLVERGGRNVEVTPLLIKLFVEQAITLRRLGEPLERLPSSIAETMVESLRRTNPPNPEMPNWVDDTTLIRAARVLGRCSLEGDYIPRDFFRDTAEAELAREGIPHEKPDVIARLVDNGVLQERDRGGTRILRFTLDPLAEYLAVLAWLDRLRGDKTQWETWLAQLRGTQGYPERMRGFLIALEDCILTYRSDFQIPQLDISWDEQTSQEDDMPSRKT